MVNGMKLKHLFRHCHIATALFALTLTACNEQTANIRSQAVLQNKPTYQQAASLTNSSSNTRSYSSASKRVALVIGNSNYPGAALVNTVNDARDIASELKKLGYEVIYIENANQQKMKEQVQVFTKKLKGAGLGLFYFAGHGMQYGNQNFLAPAELEASSANDIQKGSVTADYVLAAMEGVATPTKILILDACRNSPFGEQGLAPMSNEAQHDSGTFIAFSTTPGNTASDGKSGERNSPYAKSLLRYLSQDLPIEILFKKVRTDVRQSTQGKQTPWEHTSLEGGNLCLAPCIETKQISKGGICQAKIGQGLYEGECQNNIPHGQGVMRYADGEYYKGSFSNGVRHGLGVQYLTDGTEIESMWTNGRLQ